MGEQRWLTTVWSKKPPALAKELLAQWPEGLPKDIQVEALTNRLRDTDAGKCPPGWWKEHAALIPILASILGHPETEVEQWIEKTTRPTPSTWKPPGLWAITGVRVGEPPKGLWSPLVGTWIRQLDQGEAPSPHAWLTFEPGVAGEWMKEWFEHQGWNVIRAGSWAEAQKKLRPRGRNLVHLSEARPAEISPPMAPTGATICVVANYALPAPRNDLYSPKRDEIPVSRGWALLDAPLRANLRGCIAWFLEHCRSDQRPDDAQLAELNAGLYGEESPGEVLLRLDVAQAEDPVAVFLDRTPDISLQDLLAIEREAARRGISSRRTIEIWKDLVPEGRSAEETLADVRRSLHRNNVLHAKKLVEGRAAAIIARLVEQRLLQPCTEADAPAGLWQIWPRWLGKELVSQALVELSKSERAGSALLAGEEGARHALAELERLVGAADWDRVRGKLRSDPCRMEGIAIVEGMALVLGLKILDGYEIPDDVARLAITALTAIRKSSPFRLLPHGTGATSMIAMVMAEWALGYRAHSEDPRFGPWKTLDPGHLDLIAQMHEALDHWSGQNENSFNLRRRPPDAGNETMALRVFRLGTLLFGAKGVIEGAEQPLWPFQVPAILRTLSGGAEILPGKTVSEVLRIQVPGVDVEEMATRGEQFLKQPDDKALQDMEGTGQAILAMMFRGLAAETPDARTRKEAIEVVVTTSTANFALVKVEVEATGGSFLDVTRWLWSKWNEVAYPNRDIPPVALLRIPDLSGARAVWAAAPDIINKEIWRRAAEEPTFWDVLPAAAWRAWAVAGNDHQEGWKKIPMDILGSLLNAPLPTNAYVAAWNRDSTRVLDWLSSALAAGEKMSLRCLQAAPSGLVPDILRNVPARDLPQEWLQEVVTTRMNGWREAWGLRQVI